MSYIKQNFTDGQTLTHTHLNNIEDGIVNIEKQIPTDNKNYWAGKKFVMNGDSGPYGSALSSITNAFPYVVAEMLDMDMIYNYSIGGSVIAKRSGDYDECYISWSKWEEDKAAGKLDTSKKYLVNTEKNPPRIYQIYSYKDGNWVGGGTASTSAGRTPLCDRILAMDKTADVIMIQCGSNDWYYDWNDLGDFEDSTYRALGYLGAKEVGSQTTVGPIDTSKNLLDVDGIEFIEKGGPGTANSEIDTSQTAYFTYRNIPIIGGRAIQINKGRAAWWLDADGDDISRVNFTSGATNFTAVAPASAAYVLVCFKYEEIQPSECTVYMSKATEDDDSAEFTGKSNNEPCETFYDGLHKMCKQLVSTYKNKDIIICSPIKRRQYKGLSNGTWDCCYPEDTNHEGLTIKDYCDAIKQVCEYYSIPFIDLYTLSGLNPHVDLGMFADTDGKGAHPSVEGHKRIASVIVAQMKSLRA